MSRPGCALKEPGIYWCGRVRSPYGEGQGQVWFAGLEHAIRSGEGNVCPGCVAAGVAGLLGQAAKPTSEEGK